MAFFLPPPPFSRFYIFDIRKKGRGHATREKEGRAGKILATAWLNSIFTSIHSFSLLHLMILHASCNLKCLVKEREHGEAMLSMRK